MSTNYPSRDNEPQVIAVVGSASTYGALMLSRLEASLPHCQLVAIDSYPLRWPVKQMSAYRMEPNQTGAILTIDDIPEVMQSKAWDMVLDNRRLTMADVPDVLDLESVDTVINVGSCYDRDNSEAFIEDTPHWIQACRLSGVRQMVYLSDVRVYGIRPENPVPLTEQSNAAPAPHHRHLLESESALHEALNSGNLGGLTITVLRTAMTVGPDGSTPAVNDLISERSLRNVNRNFPLQFLHQHDLERAVEQAITGRVAGVYNLASTGVIPSKAAAELCQGQRISKGRQRSFPGRGGGFDLGKGPLILSSTKFKQASKFDFKYSSEQAFRSYCHSYLHEPLSHANGIGIAA